MNLTVCFILGNWLRHDQITRLNHLLAFAQQSIYNICKDIIVIHKKLFSSIFFVPYSLLPYYIFTYLSFLMIPEILHGTSFFLS